MNWQDKRSENMRCGLQSVVAAALLALGAFAQSIAPGGSNGLLSGKGLPHAEEIVARALERAEMNEKAQLELSFACIINSAVETLDSEGRVTDIETKRSQQIPLEGYLYEELIELDGQALSQEQARKEGRRKARFIQEARKRAARGESLPEDRRRMRFNRELMARYRTELVGSEDIAGHTCWIVRYEPRQGDLPSKGAMDRALNRSSGRLWITKSGHELARVTFKVDSPVQYAWGLVATLRKADGRVDLAPVEKGVWLPHAFDLELDLRLLKGVKSIRRRIRNERTGYRRVGPAGSVPVDP